MNKKIRKRRGISRKSRLRGVASRLISKQIFDGILMVFTKPNREDSLNGLQKTKVSWIEINLGKLWCMGKQFREVILNRSLLRWSAGDRTCARWVLMNFSAHYGASALRKMI